ncbi:alpha/beta hydrolase family protein [Streptomyces sp. NBC_01378]|uniref:alpha/beta hydrolase family protein n=2 Tax=unclassified Streptomyces TaxID=2593676 RepID=UPI003868B28D
MITPWVMGKSGPHQRNRPRHPLHLDQSPTVICAVGRRARNGLRAGSCSRCGVSRSVAPIPRDRIRHGRRRPGTRPVPVRVPRRRFGHAAPDRALPRPIRLHSRGGLFALAAGALRRGYNVIAFDGPGQGSTVREQGLHFRPDWEAVVTPVVDFALTVPEADTDRLALIGMSLGGYLAARAAAFEHRIAASVLYDGVYDLHEVMATTASRAASMPGGLEALMAQNTMARWVVRNGL